MSILPTGQQFAIASGRYTAVVTEVGATLRSLTVDGDEILWTFPEDGTPQGCAGEQLAPWPNRIRDGRYTFDGEEFQLNISEVPRNTALHGLLGGLPFTAVRHTDDEVVLRAVIYPQKGWAGTVEFTVGHRVSDEGLTVTVEATNIGQVRAPYGYGAHPYVAAELGDAILTTPFAEELVVDAERLLPTGLGAVTAEHDFRRPRPMGDAEFDSAFTGVEDQWLVSVEANDRVVEFWADETMGWGQIYTNPERTAIAIEPMTCGPDAFNEGPTHDGVIVLEPGHSTVSQWGIRVR